MLFLIYFLSKVIYFKCMQSFICVQTYACKINFKMLCKHAFAYFKFLKLHLQVDWYLVCSQVQQLFNELVHSKNNFHYPHIHSFSLNIHHGLRGHGTLAWHCSINSKGSQRKIKYITFSKKKTYKTKFSTKRSMLIIYSTFLN